MTPKAIEAANLKVKLVPSPINPILEGSIILESDTLPRTSYSASDVILFRKGAHARWLVENYVKKRTFGHSIAPAPVAFGIRILRACKAKLWSTLARERNTLFPVK